LRENLSSVAAHFRSAAKNVDLHGRVERASSQIDRVCRSETGIVVLGLAMESSGNH